MRNSAHCETSPLSTCRDYPSSYAHQNCHGCPGTTSLENRQTRAVSKHKVRNRRGMKRFGGPKKCKAEETCFETDIFPVCSKMQQTVGLKGEATALLGRHLNMGEGFLHLIILAFSQQGPGIVSSLQCMGHFCTTKNCPAPNANSIPTEKHWSTMLCSNVQLELTM